MIPKTKAERAVHLVSELNRLCFALREAGRRGRAERAKSKTVVRETSTEYAGDKSRESSK
jgi:hypothetical protein